MRLITETFVVLLVATPILALVMLCFALGSLLFASPLTTRRALTSFASGIASVLLLAANPVVNMLAFDSIATRHRTEMLRDAEQAGCVGRSSEWLKARYGTPYRVRQDEWWYTPGPWFIAHIDYVGFTIKDGMVTNVYIQVN